MRAWYVLAGLLSTKVIGLKTHVVEQLEAGTSTGRVVGTSKPCSLGRLMIGIAVRFGWVRLGITAQL